MCSFIHSDQLHHLEATLYLSEQPHLVFKALQRSSQIRGWLVPLLQDTLHPNYLSQADFALLAYLFQKKLGKLRF